MVYWINCPNCTLGKAQGFLVEVNINYDTNEITHLYRCVRCSKEITLTFMLVDKP